MTLFGRTKHSQKICSQECLHTTCPASTRLNGIEVTWLSSSPHAVFTCVCGKRIETVAWSSPGHCSQLHSPLDFVHSQEDTDKWNPLLMSQEKQLQHKNQVWEFFLSPSSPGEWIPIALIGTPACRARPGWMGRTRMSTKWSLAFLFLDLFHSAARWMTKTPWWCRLRSHMSITVLTVTCLRWSPKFLCPLLPIQ